MIIDIILIVAGALFIGVYVSWRAGRLDRLYARVEMARVALDATLLRRSSVAQELASSGLLDPATSLLLAAAALGTRGGERPRDLAESDLTRALRAAFSQPDFRASLSGKEGADELLAEVEEAAHQVFVARKFYNDLAAATRDARRRPLARVLHLSGRAQAPVFFEMDDSLIADKASAVLSGLRAQTLPVQIRRARCRLAIPWNAAVTSDQARFSSCPLSTLRLRPPPGRGRVPRGSSAAWRRCSRAA